MASQRRARPYGTRRRRSQAPRKLETVRSKPGQLRVMGPNRASPARGHATTERRVQPPHRCCGKGLHRGPAIISCRLRRLRSSGSCSLRRGSPAGALGLQIAVRGLARCAGGAAGRNAREMADCDPRRGHARDRTAQLGGVGRSERGGMLWARPSARWCGGDEATMLDVRASPEVSELGDFIPNDPMTLRRPPRRWAASEFSCSQGGPRCRDRCGALIVSAPVAKSDSPGRRDRGPDRVGSTGHLGAGHRASAANGPYPSAGLEDCWQREVQAAHREPTRRFSEGNTAVARPGIKPASCDPPYLLGRRPEKAWRKECL